MLHDENLIVSLDELVDYNSQPFKVVDDDAMMELAASVKTVGVLVPLIVRRTDRGFYEIISGHRRKRACQLAGIDKVSVVVRELDDFQAAILLVDSNLQRENLLPSEKAYAYRLKLDAIKHQGKKFDLSNVASIEGSTDHIGLNDAKSGRQIRRYIRLTELIFPLLDKVDEKIIPVTAGAEISFLNVKMQVLFNEQLDFHDCKINVHQAVQVKKLYLDGVLDKSKINTILSKERVKSNKKTTLSIDCGKLKKYFPYAESTEECEAALWKFLEEHSIKRCA